jgi:hypothetical protein
MELNRDQMQKMFEEIRRGFPRLSMNLQLEHPHVDFSMDIPKQSGLDFDVNLNLQGDELHLSVGHFWAEWFPCTNPEVVSHYREAVIGLLSGRFRILELYLGPHNVGAYLQRPEGSGWHTTSRSVHGFRWLIPWPRTKKVLQNGNTSAV